MCFEKIALSIVSYSSARAVMWLVFRPISRIIMGKQTLCSNSLKKCDFSDKILVFIDKILVFIGPYSLFSPCYDVMSLQRIISFFILKSIITDTQQILFV